LGTGTGQRLQSLFVLSLEAFDLSAENLCLGRRAGNEQVADFVPGLPEIAAERGNRLVLFHIVPVDVERLLRHAELKVIGFDGRQDQHHDYGPKPGSQYRAPVMPFGHSKDILAPEKPGSTWTPLL